MEQCDPLLNPKICAIVMGIQVALWQRSTCLQASGMKPLGRPQTRHVVVAVHVCFQMREESGG